MTRVAAILLVVVAACGDDRVVLESIDSVSGTRIKLEKYIYEDGTGQVDHAGFYDTRLHTRCTPRVWADGVLRCVPVAADALYTDAACSTAIGVGTTLHGGSLDLTWATHFIGYDRVDGESVPIRLYRAGEPTDAIGSYYERRDGECIGPLTAPGGTYYELSEELASTAMAELTKVEAGTGRLVLEMLSTLDGMRVATGLRDRLLDGPCTPTEHPGGARCEPEGVPQPSRFSDSACTAPALVFDVDAPAPRFASVVGEDGCASYASVGGEITGAVYQRVGEACVRQTLGGSLRALVLGDTIEVPSFERTIDETDAGRLSSVTLRDTEDLDLRFTAPALVDRAIRADCRRELVGEIMRCIPATTRPASTLYDACVVPVAVVELPARTCMPIAFATLAAIDGSGTALHVIGDRVPRTLTDSACVPYTPQPGMVLHVIGPALPPETFMSAVKYGER